MPETTELNNYKEQEDLKCCYTCHHSEFDESDIPYSELFCFFDKETNKETNKQKTSFNIDEGINVSIIGICDNYKSFNSIKELR